MSDPKDELAIPHLRTPLTAPVLSCEERDEIQVIARKLGLDDDVDMRATAEMLHRYEATLCAAEAANVELRAVLREAIENCEQCRGLAGTRRCARCQTFERLAGPGGEQT